MVSTGCPPSSLLRPDELIRLLRLARHPAGHHQRPVHRRRAAAVRRISNEIVAATARLQPRPEIALTTNGVGLARRADRLAAAGLDRINVSLDTVDAARFAAITRRDRLSDVLDGLTRRRLPGCSRSRSTRFSTR